MKKSFSKVLLVAAMAAGIILSAAPTNKAEANIFPHDVTGDCIGGTYSTYHVGWFGRIIYANDYACD